MYAHIYIYIYIYILYIMGRRLAEFNKYELYPYQQSLKEISQIYNDRKIDLIYDQKGNIGKSMFAEFMRYNKLAVKIPPFRLMEDLMGFISSQRLISKCYIIDMPRGLKKDKMGDFYSGVEELKNGCAFDKRYKGQMLTFDRPIIFIFTNSLPEFKLLYYIIILYHIISYDDMYSTMERRLALSRGGGGGALGHDNTNNI